MQKDRPDFSTDATKEIGYDVQDELLAEVRADEMLVDCDDENDFNFG
jgi:hypothetical protein